MPSDAYQFRVSLREISPTIWRQIQVPARYSLWDLHVAIQDCMGWKDYHLHAFRFQRPGGGKRIEVGIPDEDAFEGDEPVLPGWEHPIREFFRLQVPPQSTSTTSETAGSMTSCLKR